MMTVLNVSKKYYRKQKKTEKKENGTDNGENRRHTIMRDWTITSSLHTN